MHALAFLLSVPRPSPRLAKRGMFLLGSPSSGTTFSRHHRRLRFLFPLPQDQPHSPPPKPFPVRKSLLKQNGSISRCGCDAFLYERAFCLLHGRTSTRTGWIRRADNSISFNPRRTALRTVYIACFINHSKRLLLLRAPGWSINLAPLRSSRKGNGRPDRNFFCVATHAAQ